MTHSLMRGEMPTRTPNPNPSGLTWYADCPTRREHDSAWLDEVEVWANTAYDENTTGLFVFQYEESVWSKREKRFVWVARSEHRQWVAGYKEHANGDCSYSPLTSYTQVWSRMEMGRAGYGVLTPEREVTIPVRNGHRNAKGFQSVRFTRAEFTPLAEMSDSQRAQFQPYKAFGTVVDWNISYCE